ncbi:MAG: 16S rRNA (cytosine(967)-C(5))-methyltransferase RsmB [Lachnospiraceae bacterium]|nr:16S rRNA (cytosine(967)-C(5))-methyltransferase RsmB [Lachnospiraceae bacterium]
MTNSLNLREMALEILLEVEKNGAYPNVLLKQTLDKYLYMEKQERAFLTRLVEGTVERKLTLDYYIDSVSKTPVKKMKPVMRCIMRMAAYQLFYMDSVPDSAACNEAVKLAQKKGFHTLKGFVNGVLRNLSRQKDSIPMPDAEKEPVKALSVQFSIPEWLVEKIVKDYGMEQAKNMFVSLYENVGATTIRVNNSKIITEECVKLLEKEGVHVEKAPYVENALEISGYDSLQFLESFQQGYFQVQDVSSMLVGLAADPKPGQKIIDVCAAPGGKSIHAADLLKGTGHVEARDLTDYKVSLIEENIERCGFSNITAKRADATVLDEAAKETADIVIADLPCSGLGVLKKKSDIKYRMTQSQIEELAELQRAILKNAVTYVKSGGTLIYSTCTVAKEENDLQVDWILENLPLRLVSLKGCVSEELLENADREGVLQLLPGREKTDGFFLAKFQKV